MNKKSESLTHMTMWYFSARVFSFVISLITPFTLARLLTKFELGFYQQAYLFFLTFERICQFGIRHSIFYLIPKYINKKNQVLSNSIYLLFAFSAILIIPLNIFKVEIANLLNSPGLASLLPLISIFILLMVLTSLFEASLLIQKMAKAASIITVISESARNIAIVTGAFYYQSAEAIVKGLVIFSMIRLIAMLITLFKFYNFKFKLPDTLLIKEQVRYSFPLGISAFIGSTSKRLEQFILSIFFSPALFAVYHIGRYQIPIVSTFFTSVGEVTIPRLVEYYNNSKIDELKSLWNKLITRFSFIGVSSFFLFFTVAPVLIPTFFGEQYIDSISIFRIFTINMLINMLGHGLILRSTNNTRYALKANISAFIVAVSFTYPLVKNYGMTGAAISAILVVLTNSLLQIFFSTKVLNIKLSNYYPLDKIFKFLLIGFASSQAYSFILNLSIIDNKIVNNLLMLTIFTISYMVTFSFASKYLNVFNIFEESFVKKTLSKITKILRISKLIKVN